jgi:hypothetical protein
VSANEFGLYGIFTPIIKVCKFHEVYDSFYTSFAFKTTLRGPLEITRLIIWPISYFVPVIYTIDLCVWV